MKFFVIQYWPSFPPIFIFSMGDVPSGGQQPGSYDTSAPSTAPASSRKPTPGAPDHRLQATRQSQHGYGVGGISQDAQAPPQLQFSPQQIRPGAQHPAQQTWPSSQGRELSLNMASLGSALPDASYGQNFSPQIAQPRPHAQASAYQFPQGAQFPVQGPSSPSAGSPYSMQYAPQYHGMYPPQQPIATGQAPQQYYPNQAYMGMQQQPPQYYYQHPQYSPQATMYTGSTYPPQQFGGRVNTSREAVIQRGSSQEQPSASVDVAEGRGSASMFSNPRL